MSDPALRSLTAFLRTHAPIELPDSLTETTPLRDLATSGFARAALFAAMLRACNGIERSALADARTLGDVADWMDVRWQSAIPEDLASASSKLVSTEVVSIRPVLPRDVELMYVAATDPVRGMRWRYRGETPGFEEFNARLWSGQRCHFIVEKDGKPVSYLAAYDLSLKSRHCYLAILSLQVEPTQGRVFEGAFLFIDHIFRAFELRKLYIEVAGYNLGPVLGGRQTLFQMEGTLTDHEEWNGELWDNHIGSLSRRRWESYAAGWRTWFGAPGGPLQGGIQSGGFARS